MLFKNEKMKKIIFSLGTYLALCLIICLIGWIISSLIPNSSLYVIPPVIAICLGILSMWDLINFKSGLRHYLSYLAALFISLACFFVGLVSFFIPNNPFHPWDKIMLIEGIPVAFIFFIFFMILSSEDAKDELT